MKQKLTAALFLVTIFGFAVATFIVKDRAFSDMENRVLTQFPKFTMKRFTSGEFSNELEKYFADQIVMKDTLVVTKNQWDRMLGKKSFGNVYYVDNRYMQIHKYDEEQLAKNVGYINQFCQDSGVDKAYFLLAPTAVQIYGDSLPAGAGNDNGSLTFEYLKNNLTTGSVTYPVDALKNASGEKIYYLTDHHWTMTGAYYGYREFVSDMGKSPVELKDFNRIDLEEKFMGSLYSQAPFIGVAGDEVEFYDYSNLDYTVTIDNTDIEQNSFLFRENFNVKDKYTSLFNGNYGKITITNNSDEAKGKGTLLVFKDSYANSVIPYLIADYEKIVMMDLRYYTQKCSGLYEETGATEVAFIYNTDFINTDSNFWKLGY